ncbi:NAD(P)H dehydrogenase (quinone) [Aneurinibacillus soli]|uniref:p-benzoquinone reductase n=1 Tax=Aneurinibacillus soli TaxID=1500254 RepID=A0A0U4NGI4_9BACL|nr:NAD(P)H-dependent oxidoreductase [Aneurinibacillus soli]PYE61327.1 NAD(P)H dehydrogenase (quinone) [Aneurinibacillus soli]BAU27844.1 p-benzoquinone reductase [Aneurinibacillus soli]
MKIYVVYDSDNGHTEVLARSIAEGAGTVAGDVYMDHVREADVNRLPDMDAIIWGCPGHFGTISAGMKTWIDKLGYLWARGELIGKVGGVFCTAATVHGGVEATMLNLITPMLHQGMIIVGLPANIPENALYGSYYGVGITCPVEASADDPLNLPTENDLVLGRALGQRVATVAGKLSGKSHTTAEGY